MIRLDKYLAHAKLGTRKEVKKLIRSGQVEINGKVCKKDDFKIDENNDEVVFDGELIYYQEFYYLMLNKPQGYISSTLDEHYPSVLNLIVEDYAFDLFPIGRLDVDTEGLLLLSNDGKLSHRLLSPKKEVDKRYYAELEKPISNEDIAVLESGIELDDGPCKPCKIEVLDTHKIYISISEGRFHQVKRMMHAVDNEVLYLKRMQIGSLLLDETLELGEYRTLSDEELIKLKGER